MGQTARSGNLAESLQVRDTTNDSGIARFGFGSRRSSVRVRPPRPGKCAESLRIQRSDSRGRKRARGTGRGDLAPGLQPRRPAASQAGAGRGVAARLIGDSAISPPRPRNRPQRTRVRFPPPPPLTSRIVGASGLGSFGATQGRLGRSPRPARRETSPKDGWTQYQAEESPHRRLARGRASGYSHPRSGSCPTRRTTGSVTPRRV